MTTASAPGKIILFGEHAVVYGRPAIAVPVRQVRAQAAVEDLPGESPGRIRLEAPDIGRSLWLPQAGSDDPLARAVRLVLEALGMRDPRPVRVRVTSSIPVASGLGSGAAVTVAIVRALSAHWEHPLPDETVSELAYEVEKIHHGTPSGIDNTVIVHQRPVYFQRGRPIQSLTVAQPLHLVIAISDQPSPTAVAVARVREHWESDPQAAEADFDAIGRLVDQARRALEEGPAARLGPLMDENHALLARMGVSTPALDRLVDAARCAGAYGAKLSGGGLGGNIIAACDPSRAEAIERALLEAGATQTITTQVNP